MTKVSVGMPTYNGARFLKDAISSVLSQTLQDFELIIVDDCSTDATEDIARSFTDPRVKFLINPTHLGLAGNWNRCIELSKEAIITIFHQDDVMLPQNLEKKIVFLERYPRVGLIYSNLLHIDFKGELCNPITHWGSQNVKESFVQEGEDFFKRLIAGGCFICCPSVMARRECYGRLGGFDRRLPYAADFEMWMRISQSYDIAFLNEPLIKYRWHEHNETNLYANKIDELKQDFMARKIAIDRVQLKGERRALQCFVDCYIAERALEWACDPRRELEEIKQLLLLICQLRPSMFIRKKPFIILVKLVLEIGINYLTKIRNVCVLVLRGGAWKTKI